MRINDYYESARADVNERLSYIWLVRTTKYDPEENRELWEITAAFFNPWKAVAYNEKHHNGDASIELATAFTKLLRPRGE